jgi:2-polyprenyl-3-methyl-5-hydroxy-6-metoxy-1,4-benzoquinol methylase
MTSPAHTGAPAPIPVLHPQAPELFCLPTGYRQQQLAHTHDQLHREGDLEYWNADRIAASAKYQFHVYRWAAELVRQRGLRSVLDVGCGPGTKLTRLIAPVTCDIEGIDQPSGVAAARRTGAAGRYTEVDLEQPDGVAAWRTFDVIICADVLEHLINPGPAIELMKRLSTPQTLLLISTPDRARLRGRDCMESPKPEHVREWTVPEFTRYLRSRGLDVVDTKLFPADDAPANAGMKEELLWRLHLGKFSPRRCQTLLCRVSPHSMP